MNLFPTPKTNVVIVPYHHLASITETYLKHIGVIDTDKKIIYLEIPVQVDEELNIEITVGFEELN